MAEAEGTMAFEELLHNSLAFHPLTPERWPDFENLFGKHGAYGGCWCMWWRLKRSEFEKNQGEGNRRAMKALVESGVIPGIIGYAGETPAAWCSIAPREQFGSLNRSSVLKRLDDQPVWSLVCFFVSHEYRNRGFLGQVILNAIEYVRGQKGKIVEAYPTIPRSNRLPPVSIYMGTPSMFKKAGFVECAQPSKSKAVMRYIIEEEGMESSLEI
jgi:hypothetical protein